MKPKYSVLVIDDQKNWRELLVEILQGQFDVTSAASYEDALQAIRSQQPPFHVALTDMRLVDAEIGNEDGLKLIEYLNNRGDETKTIVVTGYATIGTAKRALSALQAYDYLEKRPSDGSSLDFKQLREIVYRAAEEAEAKRPDGFTDVRQNILLLEPALILQKKIKEQLSESGYQVYTPSIGDGDLELRLKNESQKYALILLNETFQPLLASLYQSHPNARVIILTSRDVDDIIKVMREYPVVTTLNIKDEDIDPWTFQKVIHSALAYGTNKYISARIILGNRIIPADSNTQAKMLSGKTYHAALTIHDTPTKGATVVSLSPQGEKKGKIRLRIFIQAKHMKLEPGAEAYWDIPLSKERPRPFKFSVTPQTSGQSDIGIEISQSSQLLGQIIVRANVSPNNQ